MEIADACKIIQGVSDVNSAVSLKDLMTSESWEYVIRSDTKLLEKLFKNFSPLQNSLNPRSIFNTFFEQS